MTYEKNLKQRHFLKDSEYNYNKLNYERLSKAGNVPLKCQSFINILIPKVCNIHYLLVEDIIIRYSLKIFCKIQEMYNMYKIFIIHMKTSSMTVIITPIVSIIASA